MASEQHLVENIRGKLNQISQLVSQFTAIESELRQSFETLQSLHSQEIQGLHEICHQNGISIPHKPQATASWKNPTNISPARGHHNTFDDSLSTSTRSNGVMGNRTSFIPPPPGKSPPDNPNHLRSKSSNNNTVNSNGGGPNRGGLPTANAMTVNDDMKNQFAPPPPSSPPPASLSNGSNTFGFGVAPRSVKKNKRRTVLPSNGLDEKDFYKKYWIEAGKIGEGSFARVRRITRKEDKRVFALKMVKKKGKTDTDIQAFQKEILVLQQCNHPNIVRLLDWCDTRKRIYMVVEFCDGGDVFERVLQFKKFNEVSASHVVAQVASGLEHCHAKGFVHRDLKPDNLMYLTKDENSEIKIIDFGLSAICKDGEYCSTPCGTAHYAAPEVLGNQNYDQSADMWSLGVIIYTLLCGFPPFFDANNNMKNLYSMIKKGKWSFPSPFWDDISTDAKDLITKLLQKNPTLRLTATQVLEHQWVKSASTVGNTKDFRNDYLTQMKQWQSTRHTNEVMLGDQAKNDNMDTASSVNGAPPVNPSSTQPGQGGGGGGVSVDDSS